ncbi:ABC transporter substrate-binding protein [Methanosarcina sp. T3]|uniref:ABC transporter substrate-binding protein n=1 Tax=Methanosarcina sp. T3 TaxID=3439062 RepID=UPI003F86E206
MNRKLKVLFIVMVLVAAVFLSGCTDSDSAKESDSGSDGITEKGDPVTDSGSGYSSTGGSSQTGGPDGAIEITDMAKRTVAIPAPENITRVSCLHPIPTYMTWRLAPEKLISTDMVFNANPRLVPEDANDTLNSLPVTGVYFKGMNQEQMLVLDPDVIVSMTKDPNLYQEQIDYAAPVVVISKDNLTDYEQSFRLMGEVLGNEGEANELADYWNNSIKKVTDITSTIPEDQYVKVYYASHDGPLSTVGPLTVMSSIIDLAGGVDLYDTNVSLTSAQKVDEHLAVNIEQVLLWNPDVIITKTETEKNAILNDTQWQSVNAVKNSRVYAAPRWESLDGIQSIMGLMWTAEKLHPDKVTFDFDNETRAFYSEFYLYDNITDEQIAETVA